MPTIRVLICDDHQIVRQGIRQMLADADGIAVAGEAENGPEAIRFVREAAAVAQAEASAAPAAALAPAGPRASPPPAGVDVVLMDIAMPHRDGLDVLRQLRSEFPRLPVLMLSTYPDKQYAVRSLKLGAAGYLNKSADSQALSGAIRHVAAGGLFITPAVAEQVAMSIGAGRSRGASKAAPGEAPLHEQLSHREYQVFRLIAAGRSVGEIAEQLALSSNTVSTYRARILDKTGARNDVELALYAVRHDLHPVLIYPRPAPRL